MVMTSRIIRTRTKDTVDVTGEILQEALAVSKFLVRVAKENDFWVSATKAERPDYFFTNHSSEHQR